MKDAAKCAWRLAAPWGLAVLSVRMAVRTASKADWIWVLIVITKESVNVTVGIYHIGNARAVH